MLWSLFAGIPTSNNRRRPMTAVLSPEVLTSIGKATRQAAPALIQAGFVVYKRQMPELRQTDAFRRWRLRLRDDRVRALIASRLDRLAYGHAGDTRSVGDGVSELRIHHGPGYRIYFARQGSMVILLLCGGDKSSQARDIRMAKQLLADWRE